MAERVVLHVGLMKSGTSFIQRVLHRNLRTLHEHDVLFPMPWRRQVAAVKDISIHGSEGQPPVPADGAWSRLVAELREWPGTGVVSMEFLGPRRPAKVQDIVAAFAPAQVDVVITVRDLARTIPAMWQEAMQNQKTWTWPEYLAGVAAEDRARRGPGQAFWSRQDAPGITRAWQRAAGREHVSVVTVPPAGAPPEVLWDRFASLLPAVPGGVDLDVPANPSLGLASLEVLRRLNARLGQAREPITPGQYQRVVKQQLAKRGLAGLSGDPRLGYDADWVAPRGDRDIERLRALSPRVVGDLEDLRCRPVPGTDPVGVATGQQLEAALAALEHAVTQLASRSVPRQ